MRRLDPASFADLELREHYALTGLAHCGVTYERAMGLPAMRTALLNSVDAARRTDQRRALAHPVTHFPEAA